VRREGRRCPLSAAALVASAAVLALALAGCGGSSSGFPRRCPSRADVEDVVGVEVSTRRMSGGNGTGEGFEFESNGCYYETDPAPGRPAGTIRINSLTSDTADLFRRMTSPPGAEANGRPFEPVEGLDFEARVDGRELVVHTPDAIVFLEASPDSDSTLDPVPAAIEIFRALDLTTLKWDAPTDCDAWREAIVAGLGPLSESRVAAPQPKESSRTVGAVELPARGCRYDMASGDLAFVLLADPSSWPEWVEAKQQSPARTRQVEREVEGRSAVQFATRLLVDDESSVLEVETRDIPGRDPDLDRIREGLAALVLD
jgi:hypothetical protein